MLEALISRFQDSPVLVNEGQSAMFEGCLKGLAAVENIDKMLVERAADDDFWPPQDHWMSSYRPYLVKGGMLAIPVRGVLLSDFPFQVGSWATGYEYIWQAYKRGMSDPGVRGIAFRIHSPGGDVAENFDMVDKMFAMRGTKPVRAFAHEYAYSAAYSIASVADKIVMSRTGGVGSIGVVTVHYDVSKMMDDIGWKLTFIHFGKHKVDGNSQGPLPDDVKARIQARIDGLGELFVATVARNRKLSSEVVRGTEALTYSADEALAIGLADAVGPLDDAVAAFAADLSNQEGEEQMADKTTAAADQAAIDEARAAGVEEGKTAGIREGALSERKRISAILDSEDGKKRPAAAFAAALDTDMGVEQAVAFLAKLPEEKPAAPAASADDDKISNAARFDAAMQHGGNPEVGADDNGADRPSRASRTLSMMGVKKTAA